MRAILFFFFSLPILAGSLKGTYQNKDFNIFTTPSKISGKISDKTIEYIINKNKLEARTITGHQINLYYSETRLSGKLSCGDVSLYFVESNKHIKGYICNQDYDYFLDSKEVYKREIYALIKNSLNKELSSMISPVQKTIKLIKNQYWNLNFKL